MPPQDHSSLDRKDLLRQRKHERPSEPPFDPPPFRWRDSPSSSSSSHREFSRWGGSADFRRPSCKIPNLIFSLIRAYNPPASFFCFCLFLDLDLAGR